MKKAIIGVSGLVAAIVVIILVLNNGDTEPEIAEVEDIKVMVDQYSKGTFEDESASITSHELIITSSNDEEKIYELPEDEFFVSIAPYVDQTHPCAIHSLTGCQGEMVSEEFEVYIENANGDVVLEDTLNTEANGFIDLWLPRENTYSVTITKDGKKVQSEISTFEGDNTCVTTMQLT